MALNPKLEFFSSKRSRKRAAGHDVSALIDNWRALWPNVGIVLIAQPLCGGVKLSPVGEYRAPYEIAPEKNCEFFSIFDDWGLFAIMKALGMFLPDDIHPSVAGAIMTSIRLTRKMGLKP